MVQDLDYYFPIKTDTACQSKWSWSTVWLNRGTSSSCHRVDDFPIPVDDFGSFHNLPEKSARISPCFKAVTITQTNTCAGTSDRR